jgi:glycosyltransferase involved in cell wall biosynthesis
MTATASGRKARLLVLASTYPRWSGDPEPGFVHELSRRLIDDFDVTVLCPHAPRAMSAELLDGVDVRRYRYAPTALETLVNDGGIVANLRRQPWKWLLLPGFVLGLMWATWRLVVNLRPNVIHAHWLLPQGLAVALLRMLDRRVPPFVVTSHGADLYALRTAPLQGLKRFVASRAADLTVVSAAMRDEMTGIGIDTGRVTIQPMGVDMTGRFTPDPSVARSRDGLLFVGRLVEKKGLRYLIDAMPAILAENPSASLTIAGFGPEEGERRSQVARMGLDAHVRFIGPVRQEQLPGLYRSAAVFVAPFVEAASGDREGLGLVTVEAAACGCPVVVSDMPAVRDVFGSTQAGWALPGSPSSVASQVNAVLALPPAEDSLENLRQVLIDRFDWAKVAKRYAMTLRSQCKPAPEGR